MKNGCFQISVLLYFEGFSTSIRWLHSAPGGSSRQGPPLLQPLGRDRSHTLPKSLFPLVQPLGKPCISGMLVSMQMSDILLLKLLSFSEETIKRKPEETCSSFAFKSKEMEKEDERRKASVWRQKGSPWRPCTTRVPLGSQALLSKPPGVWAANHVSAGCPGSQGSCGATCSTLPVLQPHGVAEAFAMTASQPSFSLCPVLPPSLPRSAVPKRSPQEICTQIPSSESVSRESDLSQGGSKMFNVCDEWTIFIKCTKGS